MRILYDPQTDSLTITLRDERIKGSDEVRPGVIADCGYDGGLLRFEILQAMARYAEWLDGQLALTNNDQKMIEINKE